MHFESFVGERRGHLLAPFHEDDGMGAGFFEFLIEAEAFEFVEEAVHAVLPGRVVGAAEPVGVHMDQMCGRAIGEVAVEFAGDGEGGRDDWLVNAQPGAESLGEGGFAGAQWPRQEDDLSPCMWLARWAPNARMSVAVAAVMVVCMRCPYAMPLRLMSSMTCSSA